ncbi:hypothetical protein Tco_0007610 [Tanacetum coccineum]
MFIKYSTGLIPPKKSRGKVKKKTAIRRVVKKKVTMSAADNIISDDPEAALEQGKSICQIEVEEAEAARQKKSSGRSSKSVVIQDTPTTPNSKLATSKTKLKGTGSKPRVLDESIVISDASSEGTSTKPGVLDEDKDITKEKVILEWGDEQDSENSDDDNDDVEKDEKDGDANDEGGDHVSDTQDADDEDVKTESDEDDIYNYKIRVLKDEDEEMKDAEVEEFDKGEEKVTNEAKEEAEKTSKAKDDTKKTELPPSSSSLFISLGFGDQFLKLSSDSSLVTTIKDSADADTTNLPPILEIVTQTPVTTVVPSPQVTPIISTIQQITTSIPTPTITTDAPIITTAIPESNALSAVEIRVAKLEKDVSELKTIDHSFEALVVLQSQVLMVVDSYLDTKVEDKPTPTAEQEYKKRLLEILKIKKEQAKSEKNPQFTIKSTNKAALKEYDLKITLYQSMHANKSFNRNPANHRLYHALMEALIKDKNVMDKGVADTVKDHKRKHDDDEDDDDEDPLAGPNQCKKTKRRRTKESESSKNPSTNKETPIIKTLTKGSKTSKSTPAKEPVKEPITEVIMDDAGDGLVHDDDQPQATSKPKTSKTLNLEWFKQPPRMEQASGYT